LLGPVPRALFFPFYSSPKPASFRGRTAPPPPRLVAAFRRPGGPRVPRTPRPLASAFERPPSGPSPPRVFFFSGHAPATDRRQYFFPPKAPSSCRSGPPRALFFFRDTHPPRPPPAGARCARFLPPGLRSTPRCRKRKRPWMEFPAAGAEVFFSPRRPRREALWAKPPQGTSGPLPLRPPLPPPRDPPLRFPT